MDIHGNYNYTIDNWLTIVKPYFIPMNFSSPKLTGPISHLWWGRNSTKAWCGKLHVWHVQFQCVGDYSRNHMPYVFLGYKKRCILRYLKIYFAMSSKNNPNHHTFPWSFPPFSGAIPWSSREMSRIPGGPGSNISSRHSWWLGDHMLSLAGKFWQI